MDRDWQLVTLDGAAVAATSTLRFDAEGGISGQAPCNRFMAQQTDALPQLAIGPIAATRMACPDLGAEATYLQALGEMTSLARAGDTLVLRNDAGREMVFTAPPSDR